jgi:hypothetical protein
VPLWFKDYVHFNGVCNGDQEEECVMLNDAIVLWGLLLVYGIPIVTVAYWMEKMMHKGEEDE